MIDANGNVAGGYSHCAEQHPLACCAGANTAHFRGYTSVTRTGNLGGKLGAHRLCAAALPGSHFCTEWEFNRASTPAAPPTPGAWVDSQSTGATDPRDRGYDYDCSNWTDGTTSPATTLVDVTGNIAGGYSLCATARVLACCD
jgi:hypothetical protein